MVGLDLRPGMIAVASSLPSGAQIEWVEGDALAVPFREASFDVVLCQQGLQFFSDRDAAIREMRRVLVPGGRLGIAVWQGLERHRFMRELCEIEARNLAPVGLSFEDVAAPFLFGDGEQIRALVAGAGFDDVQVESRSFEARFRAVDFVADLEFAYSVMVPEFVDDPAAFAAFVAAVSRDAEGLLARHRRGAEIVVPMHVNLVTAAG